MHNYNLRPFGYDFAVTLQPRLSIQSPIVESSLFIRVVPVEVVRSTDFLKRLSKACSNASISVSSDGMFDFVFTLKSPANRWKPYLNFANSDYLELYLSNLNPNKIDFVKIRSAYLYCYSLCRRCYTDEDQNVLPF